MENEIMPGYYSLKDNFGKKAYITDKIEVGKWYKFDAPNGYTRYGKVVRLIDELHCECEKMFELPDYRPYAAKKWFDRLPFAVREKTQEEKEAE